MEFSEENLIATWHYERRKTDTPRVTFFDGVKSLRLSRRNDANCVTTVQYCEAASKSDAVEYVRRN